MLIDEKAFDKCTSLKNIVLNNLNAKINYDAFLDCKSLSPKIKEKLFYQIAKDVEKESIPKFFELYDVKYSSELIQELMAINVSFFETANNIDKEVFLDEALNFINNIYKKDDCLLVETDLCNIIIAENKLCLNNKNENTLLKNSFLDGKYDEVNNKIKEYQEKGEIER